MTNANNRISLPESRVAALRMQKIITEQEVVYQVEDLIIAESVITGEKRVIDSKGIVAENNRRILNG
jgi:hypothetical protein